MPATYIHLIPLQPLAEHRALQHSRLTNEDSQFYSEKLLGWYSARFSRCFIALVSFGYLPKRTRQRLYSLD
jgi:hypothetical protein